jgi:uncharacterized protein (TIGR00251 family)
LIDYTEKEGALCFKVQVVPRASISEITGSHGSALRVRLAAPPVDGAANEELIRVLAKAFGVRKSAVTIAAGHTSKHKEVRILGGSVDELRNINTRGL